MCPLDYRPGAAVMGSTRYILLAVICGVTVLFAIAGVLSLRCDFGVRYSRRKAFFGAEAVGGSLFLKRETDAEDNPWPGLVFFAHKADKWDEEYYGRHFPHFAGFYGGPKREPLTVASLTVVGIPFWFAGLVCACLAYGLWRRWRGPAVARRGDRGS